MASVLATTTSFAKESTYILESIRTRGLRLIVKPLNRTLGNGELT